MKQVKRKSGALGARKLKAHSKEKTIKRKGEKTIKRKKEKTLKRKKEKIVKRDEAEVEVNVEDRCEENVQNIKKDVVIQRTEAAQDISEFNLTEVGKEKVDLKELIEKSKTLPGKVSIKKQLQKHPDVACLPIPLSKPELTKIQRTAAYGKVCGELSKYDNIVQTTRSAATLTFPLQKTEIYGYSDVEKTADMEVALRHGDLMKYRALVSYAQIKARRQNKIKSKKYRRMLKMEKLKQVEKELHDEGKSKAAAELNDKIRILERMTLKHKNIGKWAKIQKARAKYNPEARSALKESKNLGKQLQQKEYQGTSVAEETSVGENTRQADVIMSDNEETTIAPSAPQPLAPTRNSETVKDTLDDFNYSVEETVLESAKPRMMINMDSDENESDEEADGIDMDEAFADESVIEEFKEDKKAADEASRPKGKDLYLPGWGSWAGAGIETDERQKARFFQKPKENPNKRKPFVGSVIFCEDKNEKIEKHLVKNVPFPFTAAEQFKSYVSQPVSHTWNPMTSVQSLTAPKVRTRMGKIITPLDADDYDLQSKQTTNKQKLAKIRQNGRHTARNSHQQRGRKTFSK